MGNAVLRKPADKALARAIRAAENARLDQGRLHFNEICRVLRVAGSRITDVEFRDLMRLLRTKRLWGASRRIIEGHLRLYYPLRPAPIYKNVDALEGSKLLGNNHCAALVQHTLPIGQAKTWREGIPVRGNSHLIKKGTPIATFVDGYYPNENSGNHVAYYLGQTAAKLHIMEQFQGHRRPIPLDFVSRSKRRRNTSQNEQQRQRVFGDHAQSLIAAVRWVSFGGIPGPVRPEGVGGNLGVRYQQVTGAVHTTG